MAASSTEQFPIIRVGGEPKQRGFDHGRLLRERVALGVERYMERFAHFSKLDRAAARREAVRYIEPIREYDPAILAEIEGIAEGAEVPFEDVLAMNCRSELMFGSSVIMECSSFALQPSVTEDGHTYVGQNWDWAPDIVETLAVVAIRQEPEKPDVVLLDEAGVVGRMGFNTSGVALCTNTLIADQERPDGVPYNVLLRGVLNTRRLDEAIGAVIRPPRAICSNYMIGDAGGQTMDVEVAPDQFDYVVPYQGIITHGNHFAGPRMQVRDRSVEKWPDSLYRECRIRELLEPHAPAISVDHMMTALRDRFGHPHAVSRHADQNQGRFDQLQTVASLIVDCNDRACWIAAGPPDVGEYTRYDLDDLMGATHTPGNPDRGAGVVGGG
jgi:isopenicillin-N N-acyltransferase like protein